MTKAVRDVIKALGGRKRLESLSPLQSQLLFSLLRSDKSTKSGCRTASDTQCNNSGQSRNESK